MVAMFLTHDERTGVLVELIGSLELKGRENMAKSSKQAALPGMADRKLKDLHDAAIQYAEKRDERQALLAEEVELKGKLLDLMHKHKKEEYTYEDVHISIVHEEETVKVKIKKAKEEEEESDAQPD